MAGRKTIILVDDNITNLSVGNDALSEHYDVITLNSGERLMKVLERKTPDIILLDVEMPGMNGYEVIKQLKGSADTAGIPVIFLTAKSDSASELEGLSLGAIDYIFKPFSPPLLRKRIEVHLLVESQKTELMAFNENLQEMVDAKTQTVVELQNAILKTMAELVEYRDNTTGHHVERTQSYLRILVDAVCEHGLYRDEVSSWDIELILQSAQLHDVGKIAIEDGILRKPSRLTQEEYEKIKVHTTFGEKVIEKIKKNTTQHAFLEQARILASTHHEWWDGTGYPNGLKGENIPLQGRLMAIADVYDALVSERPYKKAIPHEEAVSVILSEKGTHFDPVLTDLFQLVADRFHDAERKAFV
jgi:putative two-component system response regulator